jgi:hypothetical protein
MIELFHYKEAQKHPGSETIGVTRHGAARAAAETTFTGGIVAACALRQA